LIVGFNSINFDNRVLSAVWGVDASKRNNYDILRGIWAAVALVGGARGGYGLDACCAANFGTKKSGNGAMAPVDWQRGKIGDVIDYCLQDVRLTKMLFDEICLHGSIRSPKDAHKTIEVKRPFHPLETS